MKSKRFIIMIIAIVLFAGLSLIGLVACDDDNNDNRPMTFEEGTTVDDVIAMFENGEITSCSVKVQMFDYNDNGTDYFGYEYLLKFAPNICENNLWSVDYSDGELHKAMAWDNYMIIEGDLGYAVVYFHNDGEDPEIHVYKHPYDENDEESLDQQFGQVKQAVKDASSITIKTDRIIITNPQNDDGYESWVDASYIEIYDINNTTVEIREECKNYKDIAVEENE